MRGARAPARRCAAGRPRRSWRASSHEHAGVRDPSTSDADDDIRVVFPWALRDGRGTMRSAPDYVHPVSTLRESPVGIVAAGEARPVHRSTAWREPLRRATHHPAAPARTRDRAGRGRRDGMPRPVHARVRQRAARRRRTRRAVAARRVRGRLDLEEPDDGRADGVRHAAGDAARLLLDREPGRGRRDRPYVPVLARGLARGGTRDGLGRMVLARIDRGGARGGDLRSSRAA